MGTYLTLRLKNKENEAIRAVNAMWDSENPGFENTLHFKTIEDAQADVDEIHRDKQQEHLRYIKTVEDWGKCFPMYAVGCFQVKITLGDYLCSEMAKRYLAFLDKHSDVFEKLPGAYERSILKDTARTKRKAESCLVECAFCNPQA